MDHFEFEEQTEGMTPQERSRYFNSLSKRTQRKLMKSTFNFLEVLEGGRPRNPP